MFSSRSVVSQRFQVGVVHFYGLHIPLADVFVTKLGTTFVFVPFGQFTIQQVFCNAAIRCTCPSHRSRSWQSKVYIDGIPALLRTSLLVTLSSQDTPRTRRRHRTWKTFSLRSYAAYDVQDSLQYRSVLMTQAL